MNGSAAVGVGSLHRSSLGHLDNINDQSYILIRATDRRWTFVVCGRGFVQISDKVHSSSLSEFSQWIMKGVLTVDKCDFR